MGSSSVLYARIDVALARDPRMIAAGPLARLMYVQSVLYCRENLTDGVIDRLILPLVAVDVPNARRHMARLVDVGALEVVEVGWRIPDQVWRRYNPLRSEVDEIRRAEAERKASYRDKKRRDEGVPTGQRVAETLPRGQGKGETEGETETEGEGREELPPQDELQGLSTDGGGIVDMIAAWSDRRRA
jgi:hypothetical protein